MIRPTVAEESPDTTTRTWSRLPSLTTMRFFAAFLVFAYHTTLLHAPIPPFAPINPFANEAIRNAYTAVLEKGGYVGVSFFFVLSGFVLTYSSRPGDRARSFWRRRAAKIFPNHLALWLVAMVCFAGAITRWQAWVPNLFLLHSFFPQPDIYAGVNPPSWTLCSELLFYALFPLLIGPVRRIRESRLAWWCLVPLAGTVVVALVNQFLVTDTPKSPYITQVSMHQLWAGYIFPPVRLFEFVIGMLVARIVLAGRFPRIGVLPATALFLASYTAALFLPYFYGFNVITLLPIAVLIGAAARSDLLGRRSVLRHPVLVRLGDMSFAFYLTQGTVLFWGRSVITHNAQYPVWTAIAVLAGFLAANLVAGWLLWRFVESPLMARLARPRARGPVPETAQGTAPAVPTSAAVPVASTAAASARV